MDPIKETAGTISTLKNAKVTPTASASMLVATARGTIVFTSKESFCSSWAHFSQPQPAERKESTASFTIFSPMRQSRMNAIQ